MQEKKELTFQDVANSVEKLFGEVLEYRYRIPAKKRVVGGIALAAGSFTLSKLLEQRVSVAELILLQAYTLVAAYLSTEAGFDVLKVGEKLYSHLFFRSKNRDNV